MKRTITMLCPVCQRSGSVVLESSGDNMELWLTPSATCKDCGTKMYAADAELVPTLQMLNARGIITLYHCSNAHNGADVFRKDLEDATRMYEGAYIIMQDVGERFYDILEREIDEFNITYRNDKFKMGVMIEKTSCRSTFEPFEEHSRATVRIFTRDNCMDTMRDAVTKFHTVLYTTLEVYEKSYGPYIGISKERLSHLSNRTRINMFDETACEDLGIPHMRQVVVHTDI